MSIESDSKSRLKEIRITTVYLGCCSFIILCWCSVSSESESGNWSLLSIFLFPCILILSRHRYQLEVRLWPAPNVRVFLLWLRSFPTQTVLLFVRLTHFYRADDDHSCEQCPLCVGADDTKLRGLIRYCSTEANLGQELFGRFSCRLWRHSQKCSFGYADYVPRGDTKSISS